MDQDIDKSDLMFKEDSNLSCMEGDVKGKESHISFLEKEHQRLCEKVDMLQEAYTAAEERGNNLEIARDGLRQEKGDLIQQNERLERIKFLYAVELAGARKKLAEAERTFEEINSIDDEVIAKLIKLINVEKELIVARKELAGTKEELTKAEGKNISHLHAINLALSPIIEFPKKPTIKDFRKCLKSVKKVLMEDL